MKGTVHIYTLTLLCLAMGVKAQDKVKKKRIDTAGRQLREVVVTGEFEPQSLRNSVYKTRIINAEQIRLRAATTVQQVLSTELGFRFSNDMTLGTSDISMMGMSGRGVKILLDGVTMVDRGESRESLNQIDVNTIERIEIVEGPLSVSYGTDALAGVINIITKRATKESFGLNARVQEETAGNEYSPFSKKGSHLQNAGFSWADQNFSVIAGATHNEFNGFKVAPALATAEQIAEDNNRWKPKEQWMGNAKLGYSKNNLNLFYRIDYVNETIQSKGAYNPNVYKSVNQDYVTDRFTHQLQGDYRLNDRLTINGMVAYSDLKRATETFIHDYTTGADELSTEAGTQDVSKFKSTSARVTAFYKLSDLVSLQPGLEANFDRSSGQRIKGNPSIEDYAFFLSSELRFADGLVIRPGLRFIKNSVYDAPPVIPSINTMISLSEEMELRAGYARGFRSPALRELYFDFFDASHSIMGNENLKAEQSNSFNASLSYTPDANLNFRTVLSGFYNDFKDRIDYGVDAANPTITTLVNIARYKTTGATLENTLTAGSFNGTLGFSYIGINNRFDENNLLPGESNDFQWMPEINSSLSYAFNKINTTVNLLYKFSGKRPFYMLEAGTDQVTVQKTGAYSTADLMVTKKLFSGLTINAGVRNLFDVTTLSSTAVVSGSAHATGGPVPLNYGRSYVVGLSYNWNKK